jgi:cytochrome c2
MIRLTIRPLLSGVIAFAGVACGADDTSDIQPIEYYQGEISAALGASGNEADCATCHSNDGSPRSGNSLKDIAYRTSFKGGDAPALLDAANACITGWMGGTAITAESDDWMLLEAYLDDISSESITAPNTLAPEVLADEAAYEAAYAGGDASAGAAKYTNVCGGCHDSGKRIGPATSLVKTTLSALTVGRIAQKVRTSGPPPSGTADASDTTPGPMPFFEPSELSVQDLKDIIAHLKS